VGRLIDGGYVDLRGRVARRSQRVHTGDVVLIRVPPEPVPDDLGPQGFEIPILYEDRYLVVVDKPAGLAVHPAGRRLYGTLIHFLHLRYRRPGDPHHDVVPRLLHRIDRETSGVVAAGLDEHVHGRIRRQFEERLVHKLYLAVVHGRPQPAEGLIDLPIGPARRSVIRLKLEARDDGAPARTRYRVVRGNQRFSLVELAPETGRTHQLRVHLAAIGCPLVGDKIYGADESVFLESIDGRLSEANRQGLVLERHALHAWRLAFHHEGIDRPVSFEAPLPADLAQLVD
jgi:23S rRNA pseudouridine1911/1915/1917 synthase